MSNTEAGVDHSLVNIPAKRIDAAEVYLADQVGQHVWDEFAELHGLEPLASAELTRQRLASITAMSGLWDLRGRQGGVERQDLKLDKVTWKNISGLAGIEDPGSEVWEHVMDMGDRHSMVRATNLPAEIDVKTRVATGAFGLTALHRVQKMHGQRLSVPVAGKLSPSEPDIHAHPAFTAMEGLFLTLGSHRLLNRGAGEQKKVKDYAPHAKTEFDLMVRANRWAMRGHDIKTYTYQLRDAGYATIDDQRARVVVQETNGGNKVVKNLYAPAPQVAEYDRVQTQHSYALLRQVLDTEPDDNDHLLLDEGDSIALTTNAHYVPFQRDSAISELHLRRGWLPYMVSFSAGEAGLTRRPAQLLPEFRSEVRHLGLLAASIDVARQYQSNS